MTNQNSHQLLNYFGQSALFGVILLPQLLDVPIDSEQILVHILHLLLAALAPGPVVVVQDVPATGRQSIKFLLHLDALPQSTAEKPRRLLLHPESQEIQRQKNNSNSQQSVFYGADLKPYYLFHVDLIFKILLCISKITFGSFVAA